MSKKKSKPFDKLKDKTAISVDIHLMSLLDKFLEDSNISNRSKYIENLIRLDMTERGFDTKKEF